MDYVELSKHAGHELEVWTRYTELAVLYCRDCRGRLIDAPNPDWQDTSPVDDYYEGEV